MVYNNKDFRPGTQELYINHPPVTDAEFGYKSFKWIGDDELFRGTVDDPKDLIRCNPTDFGHVPVGSTEKPWTYYPSCQRTVLIGDDIIVQLTFSRDYLGKAHDIEATMIEVLNRFRISGPPLEVIQ